MPAYDRSSAARLPFDMSDDDYGVPFQMPGNSPSFFDLDSDVGLGFPTRRADNIKVQTILGNAGDLDLAKTDGPTGWGLYTLDDAIRSYQKRNDLKVDGWLRPGGPTISKMRDQFGATLGKYPAPSPREVDEHHDRLAQGEPGLLNGTYGDLKLAPIPGLPAPDADMTGSNRSMAEYLQRHRSGLADAPDTLAAYIRTMGVPGIVQARDFVNQWDQAKPGQGGDAIRAILSALGDTPDLQRQFFGGPIANNRPIGIRIGDMRGDRKTLEFVRGRDDVPQPPPKAFQIPTPEEERRSRQPMSLPPLPPLSRDGLLDPEYIKAFSERLDAKRAFEEQERANAVYDNGLLDANNWPPHLRARLLGDAPANDETNRNFSGNDRLQPIEGQDAPTPDEAIQIAEAKGQPSQQRPAQRPPAQPSARPGQPATPPSAAAPKPATPPPNPIDVKSDKYFETMDEPIKRLAARLNTDPTFFHSIFSIESGWLDERSRERNDPSGSLRTNRDGTLSTVTYPSIDKALEVWERRWGDRVRNAPSIQEFVEGLQQERPGETNPHRYNSHETRHNLDRVKRDDKGNYLPPYEEVVPAQIYSVLRRYNGWLGRRGAQ